jgi:LysM repeat protein
MKIHTTKNGQTLSDIAKEYEVKTETIRQINNINCEPAVGEELLIQTPTRTYKTTHGDTPDRIALRFGIRKGCLYSLNPWISGRNLEAGETLSLKCDERKNRMSVANGYYFQGCKKEKLTKVMPYLTYVTFASAKADKKSIRTFFDTKKEVELCSENGKTPLIRVFDIYNERYKSDKDLTGFAEALISLALDGKYKGIVIDSCPLTNSAEEFSSFLMILRKLMIGCDLILITEINESSPVEFSEFADGSILYYPKYALEPTPSFEEGERKIIADFACKGESSKAFIDLPALAVCGKGYISIDEAQNVARRGGYEIKVDKNTLLSHFSAGKQGEYRYTSLSGIKELLELVNEFDYMGICFDIMRTPLSHLMMYDSLFKTSYHTSIRSTEGCSREGVE